MSTTHLFNGDSQQLTERPDGSPSVKVHHVLQATVMPAVPYDVVLAVLRGVNHEVPAAVLGTDPQGDGEREREAGSSNRRTERGGTLGVER